MTTAWVSFRYGQIPLCRPRRSPLAGASSLCRAAAPRCVEVASLVAIHQLGPPLQQVSNSVGVALLQSIVKSTDRDSVYARSESRPTVEPIGACQHKLRVMQRKGLKGGTWIILLHFGHGAGFSRCESGEQFLRLPFQLIKVEPFGKVPGG